MKFQKYGFIGKGDSNTVSQWNSGDNEESLQRNLISMPDDWPYRTNPITYTINSLGHRSKEIEDLDLDNYILCTGCSHTEGIGLALETTYPHVLADLLKCDYYNMGIGATGIDVTLHNLIVWFSTVPKKPKAVIIQWPDFTRMTTGSSINNLQPRGLWNDSDDYARFIDLGVTLEVFEAKKLMAHHAVQSLIKVPTVYFGIQKIIPFDDNTIIGRQVDFARDLGHPGVESNRKFAEMIHDYLINTECLSFYQNPEEKS